MNVVFGGVFNPPTKAHYYACKRVMNEFNVDKFIFLPVGSNYDLKTVEDDFHRVKMLDIIAGKLGVEVSKIEIENNEMAGTYVSLRKLDLEDTHLLIGSDNLRNLESWRNSTKLLSEYKIIVLNRQDNIGKIIEENEFLSIHKENIIIINDFDYNISSTNFRENNDENLIDEDVLKYIDKFNLYGR